MYALAQRSSVEKAELDSNDSGVSSGLIICRVKAPKTNAAEITLKRTVL